MNQIISEGWHIIAEDIKEIQYNVWKIQTEYGTFALKKSELKEKNLKFICRAENALPQKGFFRFAKLIPTKSRKTYFTFEKESYTLHDWIEGKKCDFNNLSHLYAAADTLGDFHLRSKEQTLRRFQGNRANYFDRGEQIQHRILELQRFYEISLYAPQTLFLKLYRCFYPRTIIKALTAEAQLLRSAYPRLAAEAAAMGSFIHYDVAARNFMIRKDRAYLIDFDYCRCDIPLADLTRLIKRSIKQGDRPEEKLDAIFRGYQNYRKLTEAETEILCALLMFPQKFWRISHRYFTEPHTEEEHFYVKKLIEAAEETESENRWLPMIHHIAEVSH